MKPLNKAGFTIVETMLFLGISGMLVLGILVGTGSSISVQRYRDSVSSLRSFLQQQFSDVLNVNNDGDDSSCYSDGVAPRGQSNCVILGKYVTIQDGKELTSKSVIGYIPSTISTGLNDIESLEQYNVKTSSITVETYKIEWGSSAQQKKNDVPIKFSILILRSPSSGVVRTFINNQESISDDKISELIDPLALKNDITMCINSNGLIDSKKMAVYFGPNSTSSNSIEILGDDNECE